MRARIRSWSLHQRSGSTLADLVRVVNAVARGVDQPLRTVPPVEVAHRSQPGQRSWSDQVARTQACLPTIISRGNTRSPSQVSSCPPGPYNDNDHTRAASLLSFAADAEQPGEL
jgi:hypothetical protein